MILLIRYNYPLAGAGPATVNSFVEVSAPDRWLDWTEVQRDKWALNEALVHRDRTIGGARPPTITFDYDVDPYSSTLDKTLGRSKHR